MITTHLGCITSETKANQAAQDNKATKQRNKQIAMENNALEKQMFVSMGVFVRRVEPTSDANNVLKEGDVIFSFDDVQVGCEGTVPFRSNERIAFRFLISQKFAGDTAELGIIRGAKPMKAKSVQICSSSAQIFIWFPITLMEASLPIYNNCRFSVHTPLRAIDRRGMCRLHRAEAIDEGTLFSGKVQRGTDSNPFTGLGKRSQLRLRRYEQSTGKSFICILKINGTQIKNIPQLAHFIDSCKNKYLCFEFEDKYFAVLEREGATAASSCILRDYGIPSERSSDLLNPYMDSPGDDQPLDRDLGASPVSNFEIDFDGLLWA
ncbi:hypothetical protein K1719_008881 [Acacia pycnantha]|nr:hypothetical protein K1719_008881 [Acacia pycnantha]